MITRHHNHILAISLIFLALLLACEQKREQEVNDEYKIEFELLYQGEILTCDDLSGLENHLNELRFYLHDISLDNKKLNLIENQWQTSDVVLLDFLATRRHCKQSGSNSSRNQSVKIVMPEQVITANQLGFSIGVPVSLNHQNPVKAKQPLNYSQMHWQWLSGYKFLRLEYEKANHLNRFHLGSWGCSGRIPDKVSCKKPNVINIDLSDFRVGESLVEIHLDKLLGIESESLCMGDPTEPACQSWMQALQKNVFKVGSVSE